MMQTEEARRARPARKVAIVLRVDGVISLAFGLATSFFQRAVFETAVDLRSANADGRGDSLLESALHTLSGYYILAGAALLALASAPLPYARRLTVLVALHHAFMATKGVIEAERPWMTGNPWWDVAIHCAFVAAYVGCLFAMRRADFAPA